MSLAFHLDELDQMTSETISFLKPSNYLMMCGDDQSYGGYYFEFSDFIDVAYLTEDLSQGNRLQVTADQAIADLMEYACEFIPAAWTFQGMLWKKTVKGHVY